MTTGEGNTNKMNHMSIAAAMPLATWAGKAECVGIVWQVRWAPAGLMPVRPVIAMLVPATVPSGHALKLWAE